VSTEALSNEDAFFTYIGLNSAKSSLLKPLTDVFVCLDHFNTGHLSQKEIQVCYETYTGEPLSESETVRLKDKLNTYKDGLIDYSCFLFSAIDYNSLLDDSQV